MIKIVTILGARPQFIKAAALSQVLKKTNEIEEVIVHTGQHFDEKMSDVFFKELSIPIPKYNLGINSLSHAQMTARMFEGIEEVLKKEEPTHVIVYGDTNSTLAGALTAVKMGIEVVHIEAGVRSHDIHMPEEVNRLVTDSVSKLLFTPTTDGYDRLCRIKMPWQKVKLTGDLMFDTFLNTSNSLKNIQKSNKILITLHRQENLNSRIKLETILKLVEDVLAEMDKTGILPMHPRLKNCLEGYGLMKELKNIKLIEPLAYTDFVNQIVSCSAVITDSGGLQKESFWANKPCVTLRTSTEWSELVQANVNLVNTWDYKNIVSWLKSFDQNIFEKNDCIQLRKMFGNGRSAKRIVQLIKEG
jgi:UDP-GlcNAc3NAcA epimerase